MSEAEGPPAPAAGPKSDLGTAVFAALIGTSIEWYDFFLYGTAAALVFNKLFFPAADPLVGAMLAFATYALGFVARPVGGVVFGHFGDRIGRKRLLMLSLVLMGGSTVAIGLLPTYAKVGVLAPLLLVALRLVQGFAVGGEWGGAVLIVAERAKPSARAFWTSWPQAGVAAGNLLAAGVLALMAMLMPDKDFLAWGWRVPFLLSAVLIGVGWWVRSTLAESALFAEIDQTKARESAPVLEAVRRHRKPLAIGAGLRVGENISYYVITAFSLTYAVQAAHVGKGPILQALILGSAAEFLTIPMFGWLSDRIGRRPVYLFGALGMAAWAFPFFSLIASGSQAGVITAVVVALVLHGAMYAPQSAWMTELFPTRVRYSAISLSYQVTSIAAGSLAPLIAIALLQHWGGSTPVSIYLAVACLITAVAAFLGPETNGRDLRAIPD